MNPAFSVIFLTTLIGAGQGLFIALFMTEVGGGLGAWELPPPGYFFWGCVASLLLLGAGLLASFFHLGHPERAWRAMAMWRTSWLSREVIVLPLFMAAVAAFGLAHLMLGAGMETLVAGLTGLALCLALFLCTGMIYACIKFLQEWHSPLTVINYTLLGCASGFMAATAWAAALEPELAPAMGIWATVLTVCAFVTRLASLARNAGLRPKSSMQTAIGIKHPRILQKSQGAMGGSFNTRDFFHHKSSKWLKSVKWVFLLMVFPLPLMLLFLGLSGYSLTLLICAFLVQYAGLLAERWYFFAQANHPQNLYYQQIS